MNDNRLAIGTQVRILAGPYKGQVGFVVRDIRWGMVHHAIVEIGTVGARYGCDPMNLGLRQTERPYWELEVILESSQGKD